MNRIPGLHHVTAIATDAQANADFYVSLLGLRLVKRTVNFDDPATYHLYYGDQAGTPGTILTFFPWPGAPRGARGTGETTATAFAVPPGSLEWWMDRLAGAAIAFSSIEERFGERVLALRDPDDLVIELIENAGSLGRSWWKDGPVPEQRAVRGFHSVTLTEDSRERTSATLTDAMGLRARRRTGSANSIHQWRGRRGRGGRRAAHAGRARRQDRRGQRASHRVSMRLR